MTPRRNSFLNIVRQRHAATIVHARILLCACALASGCRATVPPDSEMVRQATQAALDEHAAAAVQQDVPRAAALFTSDAVVMFPGMPDVRSRDSIAGLMRRAWPAMNPTAVRYQTDDVHVAGALAVTMARYWVTLAPPGQPVVQDSGRYMLLWMRSDSTGWRVARALPNSLVPATGS